MKRMSMDMTHQEADQNDPYGLYQAQEEKKEPDAQRPKRQSSVLSSNKGMANFGMVATDSAKSLITSEFVEKRWHSPTLMINSGFVKGELIKTV